MVKVHVEVEGGPLDSLPSPLPPLTPPSPPSTTGSPHCWVCLAATGWLAPCDSNERECTQVNNVRSQALNRPECAPGSDYQRLTEHGLREEQKEAGQGVCSG